MNINELINLSILNDEYILKIEDKYLKIHSYNNTFIFFNTSNRPQSIKKILNSLNIEGESSKKFNNKFFNKTCVLLNNDKYYFLKMIEISENSNEIIIKI